MNGIRMTLILTVYNMLYTLYTLWSSRNFSSYCEKEVNHHRHHLSSCQDPRRWSSPPEGSSSSAALAFRPRPSWQKFELFFLEKKKLYGSNIFGGWGKVVSTGIGSCRWKASGILRFQSEAVVSWEGEDRWKSGGDVAAGDDERWMVEVWGC